MKILITIITSMLLLQANSAHACSYAIDENAATAELVNVALSSLGKVQIFSSEVADFTYFESISTPMCPEELTYTAQIQVSYKNGLNVCDATLSVKKIESWVSDLNKYEVTGAKMARCKKSSRQGAL